MTSSLLENIPLLQVSEANPYWDKDGFGSKKNLRFSNVTFQDRQLNLKYSVKLLKDPSIFMDNWSMFVKPEDASVPELLALENMLMTDGMAASIGLTSTDFAEFKKVNTLTRMNCLNIKLKKDDDGWWKFSSNVLFGPEKLKKDDVITVDLTPGFFFVEDVETGNGKYGLYYNLNGIEGIEESRPAPKKIRTRAPKQQVAIEA